MYTFLKAFLVLMKLLSLSQLYTPKHVQIECFERENIFVYFCFKLYGK